MYQIDQDKKISIHKYTAERVNNNKVPLNNLRFYCQYQVRKEYKLNVTDNLEELKIIVRYIAEVVEDVENKIKLCELVGTTYTHTYNPEEL